MEHLDLVKNRIWTAYKAKGKKHIMLNQESKKRNQNYGLFQN